jgi:hypothetical protein
MQRRTLALTVCLGIALVLGSVPALAQYQLTNLVSNQVGAAKHTDPLIVNAWGLVPSSPRTAPTIFPSIPTCSMKCG